jgi:hypothetical protein
MPYTQPARIPQAIAGRAHARHGTARQLSSHELRGRGSRFQKFATTGSAARSARQGRFT